MSSRLHALILAAGEGTRMKSELPKVLHQICGRPMIAYALDLAASLGVKQPIVVIGHGAEAVKPLLPREAKVVIQAKQLGTGDAVLAAKRALVGSGDVLILYADTPLLKRATVHRLVETHFKATATCTLLCAHLADPKGYGRIVRNELGQITGVVEEADANAAVRAIREVNVGPFVAKLDALLGALIAIKPSAATKEFYLTQAVSPLSRHESAKLQAVRVEESAEAIGINSRVELARAIGVIRQRIIEAHLQNGVTIEDPQTTFIDHGVSIGLDTVIHPYTRIETRVVIGKRCSIGPFARLRSGVVLGNGVRVGNFVELVRSKVAPRVRINHVTYLGDTTVEEDVNIGAGTVTANYDGQQKHPTHIGKGAFIGCDTVLIAPVKVGPGAITGAGSVVPKAHDVPAKSVVVGVPAQIVSRDGRPARPPPPVGKPKAQAPQAGVPPERRAVTPKLRRRGKISSAARRAAKRPQRANVARRTATKGQRRPRGSPRGRTAPRALRAGAGARTTTRKAARKR